MLIQKYVVRFDVSKRGKAESTVELLFFFIYSGLNLD